MEMSSKSKKGDKTLRNINILQYKRELEALKRKQTEDGYSPKIGRQRKKIEKKIKRLT
jgi:hypothetical protein